MTEGGEALSLKNKLAENENVLLLKAFTKAYGMAGLRLGYCLSSNGTLLKEMGSTVQAWNVSVPAQMAGVAALKEREHVAKANVLVSQERPRMTAALRELGMTVIPSRTNYILFYNRRELKAPLLGKGIQIRSCANYPGLGEGWYRTAVKLPEQNDKLLTALEEIIHG